MYIMYIYTSVKQFEENILLVIYHIYTYIYLMYASNKFFHRARLSASFILALSSTFFTSSLYSFLSTLSRFFLGLYLIWVSTCYIRISLVRHVCHVHFYLLATRHFLILGQLKFLSISALVFLSYYPVFVFATSPIYSSKNLSFKGQWLCHIIFSCLSCFITVHSYKA